VIDADVARVLPRAFEMRQDVDYGDYEDATAEDVDHLRGSVSAFVEASRHALDDLLASG
jgi:uncharacterized protein (UPF0332 family)